MSHNWRGRRGFTLIELMVVIVVVSLLAGTAVALPPYLKNRATERVVQGDLDNYAQAQMGAWTEEGHFEPHDQLLAGRFDGWSDDVELSEVRTAGDRFFVRVRHTRTGYSCALDLSPRTGRAINRKVCRASEGDPALAVPPGIIVTPPPGDTVSVGRPPTNPPPAEGVLLPPGVGDLAEVVLDPGSSRVLLFPVTNRSTEARTFMFSASSANPDAVPDPARPADAHLQGGEDATIPVTVSVAAGTLADVFGDVELRAADVGDRAYAASGGVRVRAALVLAAPTVLPPAGEVRDAGESFTVQYRVRNRSNGARTFQFSPSFPGGSALSLASAIAAQTIDAFEERVIPVTYRLDAGADGGTVWSARLVVTDRDAPAATATSDPFHVTTRLVLAAPLIGSVPARTEMPGAEFTVLWQVTNRSNAARDFRLAPGSDSPELQVVSPAAPFAQRIGRGQVASVPVTYRIAGAATCTSAFVASLRVEDALEPAYAATGAGGVQTATVVAPPSVVSPGARSDQPGTSFTSVWRITNRTNCARSVRVEALGDGDLALIGAAGTGVVTLQAFEQRAVEASYQLAAQSLYQTQSRPVVRVSDEVAPSFTATGSFVETTALKVCVPAVAGPLAAPPQPQQPGTAGSVTHRVTNCTNAPRLFRFGVASSNPLSVPDPVDPAAVTIPAFGSADVVYGYTVPGLAAGGSFSDLVLQVVDDAETSLARASTFRVTVAVVVQAPTWGAFPAQEVRPGEEGAAAGVLTSRSNIPVDFCFTTSVGSGSAAAGSVVTAGPAAPACVRLGAYQSATVTQAFAVAAGAEHPHTNGVVVRAYDAERPSLVSDNAFVVTAALVLANPGLEVPATPPPVLWLLGQDRAVSYPVVNRTNAARDVCLAVVPAGAAVAAVDAQPVCATLAAGATHTFVHTLRGSAAGDGAVDVAAYDQLAPEYRAAGRFDVRVADARPVAVWSPPAPVFVRKWADFDASRSFSPIGARIAKYIWSWGLFNQRWTGARFEPGGGGVATDELTTPQARRAWDIRGTFQICLTVEDESGRQSAPNCGAITSLAETRARLAFRYRGWWYDPSDFCWDVPWDNQCPKEHGNARWEILLNQSQGDVPIKRAWATVRVDYWQTDDEFERTYNYSGNVEALPYSFTSGGQTVTYNFFSNRHKANGSVESGRWRVLDTNGTAALGWPQAPNLGAHPLVLNANLGSATGAFDGGPHWVPDDVWITLFVEDANGNVTQQSRYLDHKRSEWRGDECINGTSGWGCVRGYERLTPPQDVPVVSMSREELGNDTYRFTGSGSSPDGRIVDWYWEITSSSWDMTGNRSTSIYRGESYELRADLCEIVDVALVYVDDRGQQGRAWDQVSRGHPRECVDPGTAL